MLWCLDICIQLLAMIVCVYMCVHCSPTELDAVVFGYLYTILTTELTSTRLVDILPKYKNLNDFCLRLHDLYFNDDKTGDIH